MRNTSPSKICNVIGAYPSSEKELRRIVAKLESIANETRLLESILQQKLSALDELKRPLLHEAFTGKL